MNPAVWVIIGLVGLQKHEGNAFLQWFREQMLKTLKDHIAELKNDLREERIDKLHMEYVS